MRIIVLGGGVIGVTSAWYLANSGHEVTVIDRQPLAANETSFSNAGEISPGFATPWAEPGVPLRSIQWLLQKHGPFYVSTLNVELITWLVRMLRQCSASAFEINAARTMTLAQYSHQHLKLLRAQLNLNYEQRTRGLLNIYHNHHAPGSARNDAAFLEKHGVQYKILSRNECLAYEPALAASANKISGGTLLSEDETGDCFLFTQQMTEHCKQKGVRFLFDTPINYLTYQKQRIASVICANGELNADAFVVALGSYSPQLLNPLKIKLPIYPVKGYAMTLPIADEAYAPNVGIMDEAHKVGITRFNHRLRIAGMAELAGFDLSLPSKRRATLEFILNELFPKACNTQAAEFWCGLRPMTPDGTPIIGNTPYENLFTNCGHGTLGWTMACGSGKLLADIINSTPTDIAAKPFSVSRYS